MRVAAVLLVVVFTSAPLLAQEPVPISSSIDRAAAAAAEQQTPTTHSTGHRAGLFWSGLALGIAGATTSVLGLTALRVEDSSSGNAPKNTYQACVAQKSDPIYATNVCGALKGKNRPMLWSGVAVGALGGVMMIGGTRTSAEIGPGTLRVFHTIRF